jgi:hypothetical protein
MYMYNHMCDVAVWPVEQPLDRPVLFEGPPMTIAQYDDIGTHPNIRHG